MKSTQNHFLKTSTRYFKNFGGNSLILSKRPSRTSENVLEINCAFFIRLVLYFPRLVAIISLNNTKDSNFSSTVPLRIMLIILPILSRLLKSTRSSTGGASKIAKSYGKGITFGEVFIEVFSLRVFLFFLD